jgi:hypothetical protein
MASFMSLLSPYADLASDNSRMKDEKLALMNQIKVLKAENQTLEAKYNALEVEHLDMLIEKQDELDSLHKECKAFINEVCDPLDEKIQNLQGELKTANNENKRSEVKIVMLLQLVSELTSDLSLAKVDIESYNKVDVANRKQIDELQAQVEQNEADQNQVYNKLVKDNDKYVAEICASHEESYNSLKSVSHAKLSATQEELAATNKELAAYIRSCVAADNL